jgi:2-methylcitrate dehydratase PrpD
MMAAAASPGLSLAAILEGATLRDVPARFDSEAKATVLDTLVAAWAAMACAGPRRAMRALIPDAPGPSAIWWSTHRSALPDAVVCNAFSAHALDLDSVHYSTLGHPAAVLLPPLFATAELTGRPPALVLRAYVLGLEVMATLGAAYGPALRARGLHPTAVLGALASAAASAAVLELPAHEVRAALNLSAATMSGFSSSFGSFAKPYQVAMAARGGVTAAMLARGGVGRGDTDTWLANLATLAGADGAGARRAFGAPWALDELPTVFKRRAVCAYFDDVLDGVEAVAPRLGPGGSAVRSVVVRVPSYVAQANRVGWPERADQAPFSLRYQIASLLVRGTLPVVPAPFDAEDHALCALGARIELQALPEGERGATLDLETDRPAGAAKERIALAAPAVPERASLARVEAKARAMLAGHAAAADVEDFLGMVRSFERQPWPAVSASLRRLTAQLPSNDTAEHAGAR